jgi:putative PIN family toxin of toxin-antitoxin system
MPRTVLDTNVLLSGLLYSGAPRRVVARALAREDQVVSSAATLQELAGVLARPPATRRAALAGVDLAAALAEYTTVADVVTVLCEPSVHCTDPDDDKFLALAEAVDADYLVTGDAALLAIGQIGRTRIVTAAQYLAVVAVG